MFIGRHEVSLDSKGRIHLPAKIRDVLTNVYEVPLVVTVSDYCLTGWPKAEWMERYNAIDALPHTPELVDLLRALSENAEEVPLKNGRILISARLREYAQIEKEAVIVGCMKKIEIWDKNRHVEKCGNISPAELSGRLRELGF
jgi:MraZ protein